MHDIELKRAQDATAPDSEPADPAPLPEPGAAAEVDDRPTARARNADRHVGARIRERRLMLGLS